jgi:hypothetical protein
MIFLCTDFLNSLTTSHVIPRLIDDTIVDCHFNITIQILKEWCTC